MDDFSETFGQVVICEADETFLSPDTASTASTSDESAPVTELRGKLNEFLISRKLEPLGKPWVNWIEASEKTRLRQTKKASEVVLAVLKTVPLDSAGSLWQRLASSTAMNKALGVEELPHSDQVYLEASAEAYDNAASWDTTRQILSIMAGVGSFTDISWYIPGLTR